MPYSYQFAKSDKKHPKSFAVYKKLCYTLKVQSTGGKSKQRQGKKPSHKTLASQQPDCKNHSKRQENRNGCMYSKKGNKRTVMAVWVLETPFQRNLGTYDIAHFPRLTPLITAALVYNKPPIFSIEAIGAIGVAHPQGSRGKSHVLFAWVAVSDKPSPQGSFA